MFEQGNGFRERLAKADSSFHRSPCDRIVPISGKGDSKGVAVRDLLPAFKPDGVFPTFARRNIETCADALTRSRATPIIRSNSEQLFIRGAFAHRVRAMQSIGDIGETERQGRHHHGCRERHRRGSRAALSGGGRAGRRRGREGRARHDAALHGPVRRFRARARAQGGRHAP